MAKDACGKDLQIGDTVLITARVVALPVTGADENLRVRMTGDGCDFYPEMMVDSSAVVKAEPRPLPSAN